MTYVHLLTQRTRFVGVNTMGDLLKELQDLIEAWVGSRKYANLSVLGRISGVSYPTMRRIMAGEMTPALQTVMQLAPVLLEQGDAQVFVARHFPEVAKLYRLTDKQGYAVTSASEAFQSMSEDEFIVYSMAAQKNGISRQRLQERLGESAIQAIDRLLESELLVELEPGRIQTREENVFIAGRENTLHRMKLAIDCFDRKREQDYGSYYGLFTNGLSDEGIKAAHRVLREAEAKLMSIFQDPSLRGRKVLYHAMVSSFIDGKGEVSDEIAH